MSYFSHNQRLILLGIVLGCLIALFLVVYNARSSRTSGDVIHMSVAVDEGPDTASRMEFTTWDDAELPFYGMEFVPIEDLDKMQRLGINMVLNNFDYDATPDDWIDYLEAAERYNIRVVAQLWPEGWKFSEETQAWDIDSQARLFLTTIEDHPALFAVYLLHEPYWRDCEGCGYTTAEQQALYQAVKAIADIPLYSEVDSMAFWTEQGEETAFAAGICDYCQTSYYPFRSNGDYEREELIERITADMKVARERAPDARIVWTMQGFAQGAPYFLRMPTADEMRDLAELVYSYDIAGAWWYPWEFNDLYSETLSDNQELYPVIRDVYETTVAPRQPTPTPTEESRGNAYSRVYLPMIYA